MKITGILLIGIMALCAQLQAAAVAPGGTGECLGITGWPCPPALRVLWGWLRPGILHGTCR